MSSRNPAEVDLDKVNGSVYNQTMFKVKVQVKFATTPDRYTVAKLLVQTPQSGVGGYAFGLNNTGYWVLTDEENGGKIIVDGSIQNFNPNQSVSLEMDVQNNQLTSFINGQQVAQFADMLNPSPGAVSLIVEQPYSDISSSVLFSNFELDL